MWNANYPATVRYSNSMKKYGWIYTQFSQFNEPDTLLLVSGVCNGIRGEIIIFSIDGKLGIYPGRYINTFFTGEFIARSRVVNKPYDIFGSWYNDTYFIFGQLHCVDEMVSTSYLCLNGAYQETDMTKLYKFINRNTSSIRNIMVANCLTSVMDGCMENEVRGHPNLGNCSMDKDDTTSHSRHYRDSREKYLIFTTGSKAYTPHQIGFKRIDPFTLPSTEKQKQLFNQPNYNMFDKVDHLIDLHGYIIGMMLSPDHRYKKKVNASIL